MKPADPVYFPCAPGPVAASPGFDRFQSSFKKLIEIVGITSYSNQRRKKTLKQTLVLLEAKHLPYAGIPKTK